MSPDLDELERLSRAAIPGPYCKVALVFGSTRDGRELPCRDQYSLRATYRVPATDEESATAPIDFAHGMTEQDAAYIAAACNALPELVAELRAAREELARICGDGHAGNTLLVAENAALRARLDALVAAAEAMLTSYNSDRITLERTCALRAAIAAARQEPVR